MSLTDTQVDEAIKQMKSDCQLSVEKYKQGVGEYESLSARMVLRRLGFDTADTLQVLQAIAARGFDYCLDAHIPMTGHHEAQGEYPDWQVCYWGADQLLSRLNSLR
jgi:hypothetical protein